MKHLIGMMIIIAMVCSLAFCEPPSVKQQQSIIQKKEQPIKPKPKTEADPQGFGGMF